MKSKKAIKKITNATLLISLGLTSAQTIDIFANETNNENENTQINLLSAANIKDINTYIDNLGISIENNTTILALDNQPINETIDESINHPYTIEEYEGTQLGIIRIVNNENTQSQDKIEIINQYTAELQAQGIENIVVLTDTKLQLEIDETAENSTNTDISKINNAVDIIISQNEEHENIEQVKIQRENDELLVINNNENNISEINIDINKETQKIENTNTIFTPIQEEEQQQDPEQQPITPYVIGGQETNPPTTPPPNTNNNQDDKEDEDDDEDEDEDKDTSTSQRNKTYSSSQNPKTGDTSTLIYSTGAVISSIGLFINNKTKK